MHTLVVIGACRGLTIKDYALLLGSELAWQQVDVAYNAERHLIIALKDVDFLAIIGAMNVNTLFAIPHKINWHAIGLAVQIYHRQNSVFSTGKDFARPCFVEQTVLPPDFTIIVLQNE